MSFHRLRFFQRDITLTTGGQIDSWLKALSYYPPSILSITPNKDILTDGKDGALIQKVTVEENGEGIIRHVGFDLQAPKNGDIFTLYHCSKDVDGSYTIVQTNATDNTIQFQRIGEYVSGNWTGGYVSGGRAVVLQIFGQNLGVTKMEVFLGDKLFHTFNGRQEEVADSSTGK